MEFPFDDKGNEVKVTTTRVHDPALAPAPAPLNSIGSRSCPKFRDSVKEDDGSRLTMISSTEESPIERPGSSGSKSGETVASGSPLDVTRKGGGHWRFMCPDKDHAPQTGTSVKSSPSACGPAEPLVCPICTRSADMMGFEDDSSTIRVTNLSENTSENDLYNLFCPFGSINLLSLELDEKNGSHRQSGIVEFDQRQDAEEAIKWLNGYSYDDLTLQVEMTTTGLKEAYDSPPICAICMGVIETSVYVSNLSEETCEVDLYHLFRPFGSINRYYLASADKSESQSGFVEFDQREDAEQAISWLNGYEYDNQTLQVKWATAADLGSAPIY